VWQRMTLALPAVAVGITSWHVPGCSHGSDDDFDQDAEPLSKSELRALTEDLGLCWPPSTSQGIHDGRALDDPLLAPRPLPAEDRDRKARDPLAERTSGRRTGPKGVLADKAWNDQQRAKAAILLLVEPLKEATPREGFLHVTPSLESARQTKRRNPGAAGARARQS